MIVDRSKAPVWLLALCFSWIAAPNTRAEDLPKITYIKSFPKSTPAYVEITVNKDGTGEYKEAADDDAPLKFQLTAKEAADIFTLANKLDRFSKPLDSGLKVAFTGKKTFRWEQGAEKRETTFNYSLVPEAQQLWDWFERISETELRFAVLERAAKFDKLGVNEALLQLQVSAERNRLVASGQFLPLLDRIVKNESYLHMARERAAGLADLFRKGTEVTQ
jgi:hypothetical protein